MPTILGVNFFGGGAETLDQKGLEVCDCFWGCPPDPRLGPILGPSSSHPGSEGVPSRFAMCFVFQHFVPRSRGGGRPGPSWSHPGRERSFWIGPGPAETDFLATSDWRNEAEKFEGKICRRNLPRKLWAIFPRFARSNKESLQICSAEPQAQNITVAPLANFTPSPNTRILMCKGSNLPQLREPRAVKGPHCGKLQTSLRLF